MKVKVNRFVMAMVIAVVVFAMAFVSCSNESETFVEPTETVKIEVEYNTEETVEPTETIVVEEIVEETEPVEETKPKEIVEKPKQEQNNKDDSNKEAEESKQEESNLVYMGRFKLTAYCACSKCCGKSDGITATGTKAKQGRTIAVDPKQIPYGTKVVINGHTYVAEDCGGSIKNNRIDVFFNSHKEALQFGVQYADVYVVKD